MSTPTAAIARRETLKKKIAFVAKRNLGHLKMNHTVDLVKRGRNDQIQAVSTKTSNNPLQDMIVNRIRELLDAKSYNENMMQSKPDKKDFYKERLKSIEAALDTNIGLLPMHLRKKVIEKHENIVGE
jgi:hypothetical protein